MNNRKLFGISFLIMSWAIFSPGVFAADFVRLTPELRTISPSTLPAITTAETTDTGTSGDQAVQPAEDGGTDPTSSSTDSTAAIKPLVIDKSLLNRIQDTQDTQKEEENPQKTDTQNAGRKGGGIQTLFTEYWLQFVALVVSVIGIILAISGFSLANKKKHKHLKRFLSEIDHAYSVYKMKSKRCEAEMIRLQDEIEDKLKDGSLDEGTFHLLEGRIQKYVDEIKAENGGKSAL